MTYGIHDIHVAGNYSPMQVSKGEVQWHEGPVAMDEDPPEEYCCPITHQPMQDPVKLLVSGQVYERLPLELWLLQKRHCPMTRCPVQMGDHVQALPELQSQIAAWCSSHQPQPPPFTLTVTDLCTLAASQCPKVHACVAETITQQVQCGMALHNMQHLQQTLTQATQARPNTKAAFDSTVHLLHTAVQLSTRFTMEKEDYADIAAEMVLAERVPQLLQLVPCQDATLQHHALHTLLWVVKGHPAAHPSILKPEHISAVCDAMVVPCSSSTASDCARQLAAAAILAQLSKYGLIPVTVSGHNALQRVQELATHGQAHQRQHAARLLAALSFGSDLLRYRIHMSGIVPALVAAMVGADSDTQQAFASVLQLLAEHRPGDIANSIVGADIVAVLTPILHPNSTATLPATAAAARLLNLLCTSALLSDDALVSLCRTEAKIRELWQQTEHDETKQHLQAAVKGLETARERPEIAKALVVNKRPPHRSRKQTQRAEPLEVIEIGSDSPAASPQRPEVIDMTAECSESECIDLTLSDDEEPAESRKRKNAEGADSPFAKRATQLQQPAAERRRSTYLCQ